MLGIHPISGFINPYLFIFIKHIVELNATLFQISACVIKYALAMKNVRCAPFVIEI